MYSIMRKIFLVFGFLFVTTLGFIQTCTNPLSFSDLIGDTLVESPIWK